MLHRLHRRGNRGYGKRATNTDADLDLVTREIVDVFHRASQIDEEQCVSRLICEVNANSDDAKSVMITSDIWELIRWISDKKSASN